RRGPAGRLPHRLGPGPVARPGRAPVRAVHRGVGAGRGDARGPAGGGRRPGVLVAVTESSAPPRSLASSTLGGVLARRRPPAPTPAVRRLRALIAVTALAVVVVEALNLLAAPEAGFGLGVRTAWALLRVVGFLALLRAVRLGR